MKPWFLVLLPLLGIMPLPAQTAAIAQTVDRQLSSAIDNFQAGKAGDGAVLLLDTVLLTRPASALPQGFAEQVAQARHSFQQHDYQQGAKHTRAASRIFGQGSKPTASTPAANDRSNRKNEPAALGEDLLEKIESARRLFQQGLADLGVVAILEALQVLAPLAS